MTNRSAYSRSSCPLSLLLLLLSPPSSPSRVVALMCIFCALAAFFVANSRCYSFFFPFCQSSCFPLILGKLITKAFHKLSTSAVLEEEETSCASASDNGPFRVVACVAAEPFSPSPALRGGLFPIRPRLSWTLLIAEVSLERFFALASSAFASSDNSLHCC